MRKKLRASHDLLHNWVGFAGKPRQESSTIVHKRPRSSKVAKKWEERQGRVNAGDDSELPTEQYSSRDLAIDQVTEQQSRGTRTNDYAKLLRTVADKQVPPSWYRPTCMRRTGAVLEG